MVSKEPPREAVADLPVVPAIVTALRLFLTDLPAFLRMAAFPLLLAALINALALLTLGNALLNFILTLLAYVPHTLFAAAWLRRNLLPDHPLASTSITAWRGRHWRLLLQMVILGAIFYAAGMLAAIPALALATAGQGLLPLSVLLILLAGLYALSRFAFVLPAVAVGETYNLMHSWAHSKGQAWRMIGAFTLLNLPFLLLLMLVISGWADALSTALPDEASGEAIDLRAFTQENAGTLYLMKMSILALSYLPFAASLSLLALAFQACTGWVPPDSQSKDETRDRDPNDME